MNNILSQDEINALLMGVAEEEAPPGEEKLVFKDDTRHISVYDFKRPSKFSKEHLRTLQGFHDHLSRIFSASLSAYLRQDIKISLSSIEQQAYSDYIDDVNEKSLFYIISFIADQAILSIDTTIALLLVEKLMGGAGSDIKIERQELTEIEMSILKNILNKLFEHQQECWGELMDDIPRIITVENNPKIIHLVQANDIVLRLVFEILIGDEGGIFSYCIPFVAIEKIINEMSSNSMRMQPQSIKKTEEIKNMLNYSSVDLFAILGNTNVTVFDLANLKIGDIISLNKKQDENIQLNVGPFHKFNGKIGVSNKNYAIKIQEIVQKKRA